MNETFCLASQSSHCAQYVYLGFFSILNCFCLRVVSTVLLEAALTCLCFGVLLIFEFGDLDPIEVGTLCNSCTETSEPDRSLAFLGVPHTNKIYLAVVYGMSSSCEALRSEILDEFMTCSSFSFFSLERVGLKGSRKLFTIWFKLNNYNI